MKANNLFLVGFWFDLVWFGLAISMEANTSFFFAEPGLSLEESWIGLGNLFGAFGMVWFGLVWFGLVWFGLVPVLVRSSNTAPQFVHLISADEKIF
jgi:hypothetical protein